MANKRPILKGSTLQLSQRARDLFAEVNIRLKKTNGVRVLITQHHPTVGTSFQIVNGPEKEFHIPARMAEDCFVL